MKSRRLHCLRKERGESVETLFAALAESAEGGARELFAGRELRPHREQGLRRTILLEGQRTDETRRRVSLPHGAIERRSVAEHDQLRLDDLEERELRRILLPVR